MIVLTEVMSVSAKRHYHV